MLSQILIIRLWYTDLLLCTNKMRILVYMSLILRKLVLILIMLGLPMQGALAVIMPLCAQTKSMAASQETQIRHSDFPAACSQHDTIHHDDSSSDMNDPAREDFVLSCDGAVCHISGTVLPSAATALNLANRFSYPALFDSRFTSFLLQQPQRPPLA
ncbi:hypothetical protein SAMN05216411_1038 [Nitrosospira multiformis]|nr:hypothetical protein SAMN05216411_1038 [Nitrosospira multiformis]